MQIIIQADIAPLYATAQKGTCIDEVQYGMHVEVLERAGAFSKVRTHYRYEGWLQNECLYTVNDSDWLPDRVVIAPYLDVLDAPKVQGVQLQSIPRGGLLCTAGMPDENLWQPVQLVNGTIGYVKATAVKPVPKPWEKGSAVEETEFRKAVCETALSYLGTQYRWGGKTPLGIDCSGLTSMAYMLHGAIIYRDASIEKGFPIREVPLRQAQKGDLFYFPGHIALHLGDLRFVHATAHTGTEGVVLNSLNPADKDFRPDLLQTLRYCGTIF